MLFQTFFCCINRVFELVIGVHKLIIGVLSQICDCLVKADDAARQIDTHEVVVFASVLQLVDSSTLLSKVSFHLFQRLKKRRIFLLLCLNRGIK